MYLIALKMLVGERAKYLGLVFGIAFSTLLMSQQVAIFTGIMTRAAGIIQGMYEIDIWVMHPEVQYIEELKPMPAKDLFRVRSVEGVEWAVPMYKGLASARVEGQKLMQVYIIGVDDATLVGRPPDMLMGDWNALREPDTGIMDRSGFEFTWPGRPYAIGDVLEINDQRIRIGALADSPPPFMTFPVIFTRYSKALQISPGERNRMSFVMVKAKPDVPLGELTKRIHEQTGLQALTKKEFEWRSVNYLLTRTGIPINFGITVLLGFIVGSVVAGQTFYIFVIENLKQFGALKAIGVTNGQILRMVGLQACVVAFIGFSIGIGLTALFFYATKDVTALRGFYLPWQVIGITAVAVAIIMALASLVSIRKVFVLDPAVVFRG